MNRIKILLVLVGLLALGYASANPAQDTSLIKRETSSLFNEKDYTRIPNKDFDELIENKISSKVDDKFHFWFIVIGIFVGALGAIGGYAFNNMIKQKITEELKTQSNKYVEEYKRYELTGRLRSITGNFKQSASGDQLKLVSECEDLLKEIKTLDTKELKINELLSDTIDQLTYMYYITLAADLPKMENLIKSHESMCNIPVTSYTNLAILYLELYTLLGEEKYKTHCIEYCEKASDKDLLYGESRGTQLRLYAVDYVDNKNTKSKEDAKKLLQKVLKVDSLAYYTLSRVNRDTQRSQDHYISNLKNDLPSEFEELNNKAMNYAKQKNLPLP